MLIAKSFPPLSDTDIACDVPSPALLCRTMDSIMFNALLVMEKTTKPFRYTRKYLVMTTKGLRSHTTSDICRYPVTRSQLGINSERSAQSLVDLIQCTSLDGSQTSWFMARVHWSVSLSDTWMDVKLISPILLQELYMATFESWNLTESIERTSFEKYPTEQQLWLNDASVAEWLLEMKSDLTARDENDHLFNARKRPMDDEPHVDKRQKQREENKQSSNLQTILDSATSTTQVNRMVEKKRELWKPLPPLLTPRLECYCESQLGFEPKYLGQYRSCKNFHCQAWMHNGCIDAKTILCAKCNTNASPLPSDNPLAITRRCIVNMLDPNCTTQLDPAHIKRTALMCAESGALDSLKLLFDKISLNEWQSKVDPFERNALHLAIEFKREDVAMFLIAKCPTLLIGKKDAFGYSSLEQIVKLMPKFLLTIIKKMAWVRMLVDDQGNTLAHHICRELPECFSELVALIPYYVFLRKNNESLTPLMLACQQPHLSPINLRSLHLPHEWWDPVDDNGNSPLHHLIAAGNGHLITHVAPAVVNKTPNLFHCAFEHNQPKAIFHLTHSELLVTPETTTKLWPILSAPTPNLILLLLKHQTDAQLTYLCSQIEVTPEPVERIIKAIESDSTLLAFVYQLIQLKAETVLKPFFQRFRHLLSMDLKIFQLRRNCEQLLTSSALALTPASFIIVTEPSNCWSDFAQGCPNIENWLKPLVFQIGSAAPQTTNDSQVWELLWTQIHEKHVFDQPHPAQMRILGQLLGHMIFLGHSLPKSHKVSVPLLRILFNHPNKASQEYLSHSKDVGLLENAALTFRHGMAKVLPDLLDHWTFYELYIILFSTNKLSVHSWCSLAQIDGAKNESVEWWWQFVRSLTPNEFLLLQTRVGTSPWTLHTNSSTNSISNASVSIAKNLINADDLIAAMTRVLRFE
ncbi:hypothetical protein THRCLA_09144 [Thraustotheca clavata]|uniref:Uncharacterized protein n=1 Tax=Thraustotheca clavata TaxID=74557 RepID=A0A1V9YYY1_9STRA|nr:hypothetical protein THRCLA_09144 [Thraustotheca clavata]